MNRSLSQEALMVDGPQQDGALPVVGPLHGCNVLVCKRVDGDLSISYAVTNKLTALGATCAKRLGRDVTHAVVLRKLLPSAAEQAAQIAALRELHDRLAKVTAAKLAWATLLQQRQAAYSCHFALHHF
jgi:hypothetical protein